MSCSDNDTTAMPLATPERGSIQKSVLRNCENTKVGLSRVQTRSASLPRRRPRDKAELKRNNLASVMYRSSNSILNVKWPCNWLCITLFLCIQAVYSG